MLNTIIDGKFSHGRILFLAPMEGITNHVYRELASRYMQFDVISTEFVRLSGGRFNPKQIRDEIQAFDNALLSVQLMGDDPRLLAETVPYFEELGADIIDLNLGCPSTKVNRKGCGAAMLTDIPLLAEVLSAIRKNCTVLFSCKMRAGWDNPDSAIQVAKIIEENGADFLTIHPRTRQQLYDGSANWNIIAAVNESLRIPVVGNGDIFTPEHASDLINLSNCSGLMLGRGVLNNPFLSLQLNDFLSNGSYQHYDWDRYLAFYTEFIERMKLAGLPDRAILAKLKEHFSYFLRWAKHPELWDQFKHCQTLNDGIQLFNDVFNKIEFMKIA
ncbi:MAG: tRNA-dihydrouridine synthase family protein [Calditrichaeota bacterium]|nr:tRNA-dihydrouridine synthase family protein [Calditrichota bacterium]